MQVRFAKNTFTGNHAHVGGRNSLCQGAMFNVVQCVNTNIRKPLSSTHFLCTLGADVVVDDEDELWEDEEAGVAVKRPDGRYATRGCSVAMTLPQITKDSHRQSQTITDYHRLSQPTPYSEES